MGPYVHLPVESLEETVTTQALHDPVSHDFFVPVRPATSRRYSFSVMRPSATTLTCFPFSTKLTFMC